MIHLDTTFLVDLLREARRGPGPATAFLEVVAEQELAISVHALCELHAGAELSNNSAREQQAIQSLCAALTVRHTDDNLPQVYGRILATLQKSGRSIGTMDLLIAASALVDEAPLVTRNLDHFQRIPGLEVLTY
ncbi:MAG TPA: type II toxin-antitoxin system VapC family toxin [Thermoanaerobaculia bacterium]|nr:type II toxin-antitoxin system VapC family toxin [Thermoanaerobaculia bacterium]